MKDQLIEAIQVILKGTSSAEMRKEAEDFLAKQRSDHPGDYVVVMMNCAQSHPESALRTFCVIQLCKNLSSFSESAYPSKWSLLSAEQQQLVKTNLFECLLSEQDASIRHQLSDAIGEIGGSVIGEDATKGQWADLIPNIFKLLQTGTANNIESALTIVGSMLAYAQDEFMAVKAQLFDMVQMGIQHPEKRVKFAAVECLGSAVESCETKEAKKFEALLVPALEAVWTLIESDETLGSSALSIICDLAESEPNFFKANFKETFMCMHKICFQKSISDEGIKKMATETMITIGERKPVLFKNNPAQLQQLVEMIFLHMVEIDQEITAEWNSPPEGYNDDIEEDADLEVVRFGMSAVDRLISAIGEKVMLPVLSQIVQISLQHNDWRYQNAAIMSLSQVGEYLDGCKDVEPIIMTVIKFFENPNPKIRYAVCHCIGQIADDMQPDFQSHFNQSIMPMLIALLNDPVPRVVSHAAAALTNFVEGMNLDDFRPYIENLLQKLCSLLVNDPKNISIVKENAIAAIASSSEAASVEFTKFYPEVSTFLFNMLTTHQAKEYRQLRGQLIECLTLIAHAVGWETFKPVSERLINFMVAIQQGQLDPTDPQRSYLMSGWQRLCIVMKKDFAVFLPQVVPSLFKLIENVFNENQKEVEGEKKVNINTFDTEEAEVAINMLSVMMEELKELFADYVEQTTQIILPLVNYSTNEDIRKSAAQCLPSLVICAKSKSQEAAIKITRAFIQTLIKAVQGEYAPDVIVDQVKAMKECIEVCGQFLSQSELSEFSKHVFQFLSESDKRKMEDEKTKLQDDMEDDDIELLDQEVEVEEDLQVQIAELLGILFKTHQKESLEIANYIYTTILPQSLDAKSSAKMHKFGIFLVDDMVEYLGYQLLADKWLNLLEALIKYSTAKSCEVRQASVYGIGMFAEKSVGFINESNVQCLANMIQALKSSLEVPQGDEKSKVYGHTKDNSVAAIGRILKNHSDKVDSVGLLNLWLTQLPLKFDKNEGYLQHQMLVELVTVNPATMLGPNGENLPRIIELYACILDGKCCNDAVKTAIAASMKSLNAHPNFQNSLSQIGGKLSSSQKQKLEAVVQ